jgi:ABC-type multidrug transport system permease subunit
MPPSIQKLGLVFFDSWSLDGFLKVFWREQSVWSLWPQVTVLVAFAALFLIIANRLVRRWDAL